MPGRAAKRRKLSPSEEEEDSDLVLSGEDATPDLEFAESQDDDNDDDDDDDEGDEDSDLAGSEEDSDDDDESDAGTKPARQLPKEPPISSAQRNRKANGIAASALTGELYKSDVFKFQVDDLLQSVRPKYTTKDKGISQALRALKDIIEAIPARSPASPADAEARLRKEDNVITPFPEPRPPKDANYKLQYAKTEYINAVGSFPLNLGIKTGDEVTIDLVVQMPDGLFQEKDYLNHRYFYKRAYYVACLAAGIKASKDAKYKLNFEKFQGNQLAPVLVVEITRESYPKLELPAKILKVVIIPTIGEDLFSKDKLFPSRNCVRPKDNATAADCLPATSFYNSSMRADGLALSYLTLLHQATNQTESYRDACILGRVWLRQRGFGSRISSGGFGNFEWAILTALLLRGGGPNGNPAFAAGYSSYQLFKAMLQYLTTRDLAKSPQIVGSGARPEFPKADTSPMLWDADRAHNVLFKMTPWSWKLLQYEAKAAIAMLSDSTFDHFDETFILKSERNLLRYDVLAEIPVSILGDNSLSTDAMVKNKYSVIYKRLVQGLADRVKLVSLMQSDDKPWAITSKVATAGKNILKVGFVVDAANAYRLIDHGPPAEDKVAAAKFRKFWGPKAELRRFRDGSILETVIWPAKDESKSSVFKSVLSFILERHVGDSVVKALTYNGDADIPLLPHLSSGAQSASTAPFQLIMDAFRQFEQDIRSLDDIPLQIRHLLASDPFLSYSSVDIPRVAHKLMKRPADVVLQFEGSARWPDDFDAIQRTKMAFFLKIAELLEHSGKNIRARVGLENGDAPLLNQSFLDVHYAGDPSSSMFGAAFRIRIHHDRELTLLERQLNDKSLALSQSERQDVAHGIATHKRVFIKEPAHTQALQTLATRFPAFSGTVRLLSKWVASHRLEVHITPYVLSLFAARAFTNPYPWNAASSPQAGFLRSLLFLSRWNWRTQPWTVDLGTTMRKEDVEGIRTRFEAWRRIDLAMNRVVVFAGSNIDREGTTWTDNGRPARVVAGRLVGLAKAAVEVVSAAGAGLDIETLFESGLDDYDFLIHLDGSVINGQASGKRSKPVYKNLELQQDSTAGGVDDFTLTASTVGFAPASLFLADLERVFGHAALFFADESQGGDHVIAGLWNPSCEGRAWKLSLGYNSLPEKGKGQEDATQAKLNKSAILAEIARLGGDMIDRIEMIRR